MVPAAGTVNTRSTKTAATSKPMTIQRVSSAQTGTVPASRQGESFPVEGLFDRNLAPTPAPEPAIGCDADAGDPGRPDGCRGRPLRLRRRPPRPLRRRERLHAQRPGGAGAQSGGGGLRRAGADRRRLGLRRRSRQRPRGRRGRARARDRRGPGPAARRGRRGTARAGAIPRGARTRPSSRSTRSACRSRRSSRVLAAADAAMRGDPRIALTTAHFEAFSRRQAVLLDRGRPLRAADRRVRRRHLRHGRERQRDAGPLLSRLPPRARGAGGLRALQSASTSWRTPRAWRRRRWRC